MMRIARMTFLMAAPYFLTMNFPAFEATTIPASNLDLALPLVPHSSWIYFSFYFFLCLPVFLCPEAEVRKIMLGYLGIVVISNLIFYVWPTAVSDMRSASDNFGMSLIVKFDNGRNSCPSLHASLTVFCALMLNRQVTKLQRFGIWVWAILILASTLLTKQHMLFDIFAGSVFGVLTVMVLPYCHSKLEGFAPIPRL